MKVLSFGSLNIDYVYTVPHFVAKGETLSARALNIFTGGKGLNQSVALARAGVETYHAGAIGTDGRFLLELLKESGVNIENVRILSDIKTGHAIIQNDAEGDNCILLFGGANQQVTDEQVDSVFENFGAGDYLLIQNEINNLPYIVKKAKENGMKVVLNPSPMDEKVLALPLDQIDFFVLNEIEAFQVLEEQIPESFKEEEIAMKLHEKFPQAVIVMTLGSKGSVCVYSGKSGEMHVVNQQIYKVSAVDTTAAGDTYTGYFLGGILGAEWDKSDEKAVKEAMDLASKASAIAVGRPGAAPSIPYKEEVQHF